MFDWLNNIYGKNNKGPDVSKDLTAILTAWPLNTKSVNARIITCRDGETQLQIRLDCGILQMFLDGRPDGQRPHKCQTMLEYMERTISTTSKSDKAKKFTRREWTELDREMTQYYHRRVGLLTVARNAQEIDKNMDLAASCYRRAVRDAEFTLQAMDFIHEHCDDDEFVEIHERFRPFVLWHRTIAMTQQKILDNDFDLAIEQVKMGMGNIAKVYEDHGLAKWLKHDPSMLELKQLEKQIRKRYNIKATLDEQLQEALANENYEKAADIRDQLKARGRFPYKSLKGIQSPTNGL
jgi:hypothetical protein